MDTEIKLPTYPVDITTINRVEYWGAIFSTPALWAGEDCIADVCLLECLWTVIIPGILQSDIIDSILASPGL